MYFCIEGGMLSSEDIVLNIDVEDSDFDVPVYKGVNRETMKQKSEVGVEYWRQLGQSDSDWSISDVPDHLMSSDGEDYSDSECLQNIRDRLKEMLDIQRKNEEETRQLWKDCCECGYIVNESSKGTAESLSRCVCPSPPSSRSLSEESLDSLDISQYIDPPSDESFGPEFCETVEQRFNPTVLSRVVDKRDLPQSPGVIQKKKMKFDVHTSNDLIWMENERVTPSIPLKEIEHSDTVVGHVGHRMNTSGFEQE